MGGGDGQAAATAPHERQVVCDFRCYVTLRYQDEPKRMPEVEHDIDAASVFNFVDGIVPDKARQVAMDKAATVHRMRFGQPVPQEVSRSHDHTGHDVSCWPCLGCNRRGIIAPRRARDVTAPWIVACALVKGRRCSIL